MIDECNHIPEGYHRLDDPAVVRIDGGPSQSVHRCRICGELVYRPDSFGELQLLPTGKAEGVSG